MSKSYGIPESISLSQTTELSGIISRLNTYVSANPENNYYPNQQITIQLPNDYIDLKNHSLQFTVATNVTGGTYGRFNKDIRSIFKRITVSFGSKIIIDVSNQNLLYNILNDCKDNHWADTAGKILNGAGDATSRGTDFTNSSRVYAVQLYSFKEDLLSKAIPFQKLSVPMYINIYLAAADECIETDGTNPSYIVNNVQLHYSALTPDEGWNQMYNQKVSNGISICFRNYENSYFSSLLLAGSTRSSATLNFRSSSLLGLVMVMRLASSIQAPAINDKLNRYDFNSLSQFSVRIGSFQQPLNQLVNYADMYSMFVETFGLSTQAPLAAAVNWNTTNFVACVNLSRHPFMQNRDCILTNGIDTSISSAIIADFQFAAPLAANYVLDVFAVSENQIVLNSSGGITWMN